MMPVLSLDSLLFAAMAAYAIYAFSEVWLPRVSRPALAVGVALQLAGWIWRGVEIEYFPLTNKFESFYAFSLTVFAVGLFVGRGSGSSRMHRLALFVVGAAFLGATLAFERTPTFAPPLMLTIWYPLHVPTSFLAYALWTSAAAAGLAALFARTAEGAEDVFDRRERLARVADGHAFAGWCVFSVSMLFGGAWGYVAWGAYFLWDPKVVWSVVVWLFFSGFVHLRHWPAGNRPRVKSALALVGFGLMLVAYVGTSFLFGHGSHAFG